MLDLYCKAGGASWGYHLAGFGRDDIVGVDIEDQPNYPFYKFVRMDALEYLKRYGHLFDFIHASPPCQKYSQSTNSWPENDYPDLIAATRELLIKTGKPWVMENVAGAPLIDPIMLCGWSFGIRTYRHRLFESNFPIREPEHLEHPQKVVKMGRPVKEGDFISVVGHFSGAAYARKVMGIDWMSIPELAQAIPPCYTEYVGKEYFKYVRSG